MLGKIVDGKLTYPPHKIVLLGMQIFNPTPAHAIAAGYKEVVETAMPEEPSPDGQHYESYYIDKGETIKQEWKLVEDAEIPPQPPTLEERVSKLEENQSEMDRIFDEVVNYE